MRPMLLEFHVSLRGLFLLASVALAGCAHGPCKALSNLFGCDCVRQQEQPEFEDIRVQLPVFDSTLAVDTDLDGYTLQAIRIAADDLLDPDPVAVPCGDRQTSHRYRARREGDIIFVRIEFKPENCGRSFGVLDGGATYAISVDGRILRRSIDSLEPHQDTSVSPDMPQGNPAGS
jgi:hypothetical protein